MESVYENDIFTFINPLKRHFTILGQENAQNMTRYYNVELRKNTDGKRSNKMAGLNDPNLVGKNSGILNPLFHGLIYNTRGHFAHCSYFSSPPRGEYIFMSSGISK